MPVVVITPPQPVVTWAEAKAHLRIDDDTEQAYVEALIAAAQGHIDGPDGWLGRSVGVQTLELRHSGAFWSCSSEIRLRYPPFIEVESVTYLDSERQEQTVDTGDYVLVSSGFLAPHYGRSWPSAVSDPDAVRVRYKAGYAEDAVPAPIKQAILLMVGEFYAQRENATEKARTSIPLAAERLLSPLRVWGV